MGGASRPLAFRPPRRGHPEGDCERTRQNSHKKLAEFSHSGKPRLVNTKESRNRRPRGYGFTNQRRSAVGDGRQLVSALPERRIL